MLKRAANIDPNTEFECPKLNLEGVLGLMCEEGLKKRFESLACLVQIGVELIKQTAGKSPALVKIVSTEIRRTDSHLTAVHISYVDAIVALIKIRHALMTWQKRVELFVIFYLMIYHKYADVAAFRPTVEALVRSAEKGDIVDELKDSVMVLIANINAQVRQPTQPPYSTWVFFHSNAFILGYSKSCIYDFFSTQF